MFLLPMGVVAAACGFGTEAQMALCNWGGVFYNIGFATLGNIIGGCIFVGLVYWFGYRKKA